MTIVEQSPAEEQQVSVASSGDGGSTKEKKSVLKKVTEKAKDKVKRLGSKLKPKSGEKAEDHSPVEDEDGEELGEIEPSNDTPQKNSTSRDLDVPLDEFALIKQREAEAKDDEGSAKGGLGDHLTEGLSSQSIAEQEPSPDTPLQALPTEYHYKEEDAGKDENVSSELSEPSEPASESKDGSLASSEPKDEHIPSVPRDEPAVSREVENDPVSGEQSAPVSDQIQERNWPEEDLSLKTQGQVEDTRAEKPETPVTSPREQTTDGATEATGDETSPKFSEEDIQALSSSNLYTGEPDIKADKDKEDEKNDELVSGKPELGEQEELKKDVPSGDEPVSAKPEPGDQEDLKQDVPSADTKLEDESSANTGLREDRSTEVEAREVATDVEEKNESLGDEKAEPGQVTSRSSGGDEGFEDAKPVMDESFALEASADGAGDGTGKDLDAAGDSGESSLTGSQKNEVPPEEPEVIGNESAGDGPTEVQESASSVKSPGDDASTESQAASDSGNALEKSLDDTRAAEKSDAEIKEETQTNATPENGEDSKPEQTKAESAEEDGLVEKGGGEAANDSGVFTQIKGIASKLGYGGPAAEEKNVEDEQNRVAQANN